MKIEKVSEDVIRITLTAEDLKKRNLDAQKFKYDTPQYERLLLDVISHAEIEFGFDISECRVVHEPASNKQEDHIITVTRTSNAKNIDNSTFDFNPAYLLKILAYLKELLPIDQNFDFDGEDKDFSDELHHNDYFLNSILLYDENEKAKEKRYSDESCNENYEVLVFNDFENLISMVLTIPQSRNVPASLYKYNDNYYISYRLSKRNAGVIEKIRDIASEFDGKYMPASITRPILEEHANKIIKRGAFSVLLNNFAK